MKLNHCFLLIVVACMGLAHTATAAVMQHVVRRFTNICIAVIP